MLPSVAGLLRVASLVICLIVLGSFAIFVVNQTSSASTHQQELNSGAATTTTSPTTPGSPRPSTPHTGALHKALDDASNELTSPFAGFTSGSSSQWAIRGVNLLLALIVYGFCLGFLARVIRVRA